MEPSVKNVTQCQDFDECSINAICDQKCKNTPGSYECSCVKGYSKSGNRCIAINVPAGENATLVFITQNNMQRTSLNGQAYEIQSNNKMSILDVWHRNRTVCGLTTTTPPQFQCQKIDNFDQKWQINLPPILSSFDCEYI
uniref:EGF-like domain-containing protein n=1 Tax=Megaselia scalaris TaxID=36166 RepID=T1GSU7_MEGSC